LSGLKWLLKKCTVNRKTAARTASSPWTMVATLNTHPGRTEAVASGTASMKPLPPMIAMPQNTAQ